jgi:hypothetical protein
MPIRPAVSQTPGLGTVRANDGADPWLPVEASLFTRATINVSKVHPRDEL